MSKFKTFLSKANKVHKNKYTYIESSYTTNKGPIEIICPFHGKFVLTVRQHVEGNYPKGCPKCPKLYPLPNRAMSTEEFIVKARTRHGDKYSYAKSQYVTATKSILITCPIHGDFEQRANQHLYGNGCPACAREATLFKVGGRLTEEELKSALTKDSNKHIEIDFSTYTGWEKKTLKCVCPEHGEFTASPKNFHHRVHGCIDCTENLNSHSRSNYVKIAKRNMQGKARLYVIRCWSEDEEFYKVGITTTSIRYRFSGKSFPYKYEIIQEIIDDAENIWNLEKVINRLAKDFQYTPKQYFHGVTECYKFG